MNEQKEEHEKAKGNAKAFANIVYVGGVIAATIMFITFVLTAFPADAYFTRTVMSLAGAAVGCSMLAFPIALHNWAITKDHRKWTTILYYIEMLVIAVNTVVSFVNLLAKYSNYTAPEWTVLYEPLSVASIVYTIFAWGTVFLLDPDHKIMAQEQDADSRFARKVAQKRDEFIDSVEGEEYIMEVTKADVAARYHPANYAHGKKHFGNVAVDPKVGFVSKEANVPLAKIGKEEKGE